MYAYGTKLHKRIFVLIMFAILYYSSFSFRQWSEGNLTPGDRD